MPHKDPDAHLLPGSMAALSPQARSFVDKWLAQEPEMEPVLGFQPSGERGLAACWGALQHELFDAMTLPRDAGVAQVKLAWWGEALARGAGQEAAHPLVRALFTHDAAARVAASEWQALAFAAVDLGASDETPSDLAAALRLRSGYARAVARIDAVLFGTPLTPAQSDAVAVGLMLRELRAALRGQGGRVPFVPLQLMARHSRRAIDLAATSLDPHDAAVCRDLCEGLAAALAKPVPAASLRRCRIALDRRLLQQLGATPSAHATTLSRWTALWTSWRAARRSEA